jgi:hypothetical protein
MKIKLRLGMIPSLFFAAKVLFEGEQNASPEKNFEKLFLPTRYFVLFLSY